MCVLYSLPHSRPSAQDFAETYVTLCTTVSRPLGLCRNLCNALHHSQPSAQDFAITYLTLDTIVSRPLGLGFGKDDLHARLAYGGDHDVDGELHLFEGRN